MQISITEIKSVPQNITIKAVEYYELKRKAGAYDRQVNRSKLHMKNLNASMTSQERHAKAIKAANARWHKEV